MRSYDYTTFIKTQNISFFMYFSVHKSVLKNNVCTNEKNNKNILLYFFLTFKFS